MSALQIVVPTIPLEPVDGIPPAWIYHKDKLKSKNGFGDLDLIFKVTGGFRWTILVPTISLEPIDGIPPNLPGYIIRSSLRAD